MAGHRRSGLECARQSRRASLTLACVLALVAATTGPLARERAGQEPQPPQPPARPTEPAPEQPPAAPGEQPPPTPIFRTGINFVRVDVIVSDKKGNPVGDLEAADFEVLEDGKPQTIETFKLVSLTGTPEPGAEPARQIRSDYDEETEAAREDARIFVFMLDDYHVRRGASMSVREPLVSFIRSLGPLDLLGVMYPLTPTADVKLTRNHDAVVRAIENFWGRKYDYTPRNEFEERYSMYPAEVVERVRNQVSLSALRGLAIRLGGLREGRKAIILVSEGYSNYLPPQLRDPVAEMPGMGNPARARPGLGDGSLNEERAQFFSNLDILNDLRQVYTAANRANTAIYSLDPRGLAVFGFDINEGVGSRIDRQVLNQSMDTLRVLSDETDGRAIVNRNDLEGGLRQVVRDSSAYYLIGYNSSQAPTDGKFHEIKVRVKRSGVQIRARKGYWALTAEETARATAPPKPEPDAGVTRALAAVESPRRANLVRTWVGMAPAASGKTRVTFVWEPVSAPPGERREVAAGVSLAAMGDAGGSYFRGPVPPAAQGLPATSASVPGRVEFDAPPGEMQMRVAVQDAQGRTLDTDVSAITVPDFTAPEPQVSTPEVFRTRTAREFQTIVADPAAVPTAAREFRRTERLLIRFAAGAPGGVSPSAAARLLNRAGQPMLDLTVQPLSGADGRFQVDLPLAGLAAGEYVVEVSSSAGEARARQFVGIRVGS